jgi:hypothetical protein
MAENGRGTMGTLLSEGDKARQGLLKKIEELNGSRVVSYVVNWNASPNFMDHNDPIFFNDLIECATGAKILDVIIDSPGGDANTAERLAEMCRLCSPKVRTIVINMAKSAATMFALATDEIMMGYLSEIGPIDPQVRLVTPQGSFQFIPAYSLLGGVNQVDQMMKAGIDQRIVLGLLQKIDPAFLDFAGKAIAYSRSFAETQLKNHMLSNDPEKAKKIAKDLSDNNKWLSHGKRIGIREATELGLNITPLDRKSDLWKLLWEYYGRAQMHLNSGVIKLYETSSFSLSLGMQGQRVRAPPQNVKEDGEPPT